jgi:hypothetical protein
MAELPPDALPLKLPRKGGRKPGPVADKQRHVVSVRLTDAEYLRLTEEATKFNRGQGEVLRLVWLNQNSTSKLAVPPTPEQAKQIAQLAGMADDLGKLAKQGGHSPNIGKGLLLVLQQMHALLKQLSAGRR